MKSINLILLLFFLTSCLTVGRIERNCDKFAAVCVKETETKIVYRDTTIYKDRIVHVPLPKDTVKIRDTIRIINNRAYLPTKYYRFGLIGVNAGVNNSLLKVNAYLTDSTILHPLRDTITLEGAITEKEVLNTVVVKETPKWAKKLLWGNIILVILVVAYFVLKMRFKGVFNSVQKLIDKTIK